LRCSCKFSPFKLSCAITLVLMLVFRTAEIAIVIFVGCMPSFSRLYHHYRGTGPSAQPPPRTAKAGLVTFGSSEKKGKSGRSGKLSSTMAKYVGMGGTGMTTMGMTTMGTQGGFENDDTLELREHATSTANTGRATPPETFTRMDAMENGGQPPVSDQNGAQNHIWKTSQVRQTYSRLSDDEWRNGRDG
jgi:hypothetical protein